MKTALVLEDRDEDFESLEKLIYSYDATVVIQRFKTIDEFAKWFGELTSKNSDKKDKKEEYIVSIIISNYLILGAKHISLFNKINSYLAEKKLLEEDKTRTPLLITARDVDGFERENFQFPIFDNILFKPIDKSVGIGKMDWAIREMEAAGKEETAKQQPVSPLEMLQDVQIDRITELGFRSVSAKPIPIGKVAKYYIPSLKPLGDEYGVYANCTACIPVDESKSKFICSFSFFGLTDEKARNIRKVLDSYEETTQLPLIDSPAEKKVGVVLIVEEADLMSRLEGMVDSAFDNVEIKKFENFMDYYSEVDAEKAAKSWLGQFSNTKNAVIEYDKGSGIFLKVFKKGEDKNAIQDYLGLNFEQFKRFKTLCLTSCRPELRKNLGLYWTQEIEADMPLIIRDQKRTHFITLTKSEYFDEGKGNSTKLRIEIRPSTPEEVVECKKYEKRLPEDSRFVFTTERITKLRDKSFWQELRNISHPKRPPHEVQHIVVGQDKLQLYDQVLRVDCFSDYIMDPFDPVFLKKKMKYLVPELASSDGEMARSCLDSAEMIKAGTQVTIKTFSEVSLTLEHHKGIPKDTFREFVIYIQAERLYEELLAKSIGTEKDENNKDIIINHFTIFGHGDKTNQRIRQWLNEQYVLSKKESEGGE